MPSTKLVIGGAAAGAIGVRVARSLYGRWRLLPPGPSRELASVDELARRFYVGLDPEQRDGCCVDYDHPLRQYHNRGVWGGGSSVFRGFDREQRGVLTDIFHAGLSPEGQKRIPEEYFTRWSGVHGMRVLVCGDPTAPPYQVILTGAHLNLRLGGRSREGVAFGGPQVYGDQRGNGRAGLPGNLYREQFLLAERLLTSLDPGRRRAATLEQAPIQTQIELRGRGATPAGILLSELASDEKGLARDLVHAILSTYVPEDVAYARECLEANGGIDALAFSTYETGEDAPIPPGQVFRLEGPAAVFYFRGHPHVHAFVNVGMDGDAPLSVGELLGDNPAVLEGAGVQELFERALRAETGTDLAYYPLDSVVGRLRAGPIRSGDIYTLESWQGSSVVAEIRGSRLGAALQQALVEQGAALDPEKSYSVATTDYGANGEHLGRIDSQRPGPMVRELAVGYLKKRGFAKA